MIWLILVTLGHTGPGVILATNWADDNAKMVAGWMLLTSVTLLYAAFGMDGEEQGRLALVIAGPVWVWFVVCITQGLEYTMGKEPITCLLYTSPSPRDVEESRMPSSA